MHQKNGGEYAWRITLYVYDPEQRIYVCDESIILCKRRVKYLSTIVVAYIIFYIYTYASYIMTYIYIMYCMVSVQYVILFVFLFFHRKTMLSFVPCDRCNINRIVYDPGGVGSQLRCIPFVYSVGPTTERYTNIYTLYVLRVYKKVHTICPRDELLNTRIWG